MPWGTGTDVVTEAGQGGKDFPDAQCPAGTSGGALETLGSTAHNYTIFILLLLR